MKTGTALTVLALGVAFYYFAQLGTAAATVQIVFSGIQPMGLLKYRLNFIIQNVSNATVDLNSLAADVTINGNDVGNISKFGTTQIGPNSQTTIDADLNVSLLSLPGAIRDLLTNSHGTFDFRVIGNMNINTLVLPVDVEQTINI